MSRFIHMQTWLENKRKPTIRSARASNKKVDLSVTERVSFKSRCTNTTKWSTSTTPTPIEQAHNVAHAIQNLPQIYNNPPHRPTTQIPPCLAPSPSPRPPPTQRTSSRVKKVTVKKNIGLKRDNYTWLFRVFGLKCKQR